MRAAREEFEAELALNPSDAVAEYEVGQILLAEQDPSGAAARFEKAAALDPNFAEALVAVANRRRSTAEAVPLLERAVKLQPTSESAHYAPDDGVSQQRARWTTRSGRRRFSTS